MKITKSTVTKIAITDVADQDSISVYIENIGTGRGKITITSFNESWSHYWNAMGDITLEKFFIGCSIDYLICKLKPGLRKMIEDNNMESLIVVLKDKICKDRRNNVITIKEARSLFSDVNYSDIVNDYGNPDVDIFSNVFGSEWYEYLPKRPNPEYEYLQGIIKTIQEALRLDV